MSGVEPGVPPAQLNYSASAPVIREPPPTNAEYFLPVKTLEPRVPLGRFPKDSGKTSSRLADIERQAKKCPAPGKYDKVSTWADPGKKTGTRGINESCSGFGFAFMKDSRWKGDAEDMVKKRGPQPGPGQYENKEFNVKGVNAVKQSLSDIKRPVLGYFPKGKNLTFLDKIGKGGPPGPPPSKYGAITKSAVARNMLEPHQPALAWTKSKTESRKKASGGSLAPNHYTINYKTKDLKMPACSFPKAKDTNFIDQTVRAKNWQPAPGKYDLIKVEKYSRGAKYCQVNNVGRSSLNGLF
ncbi:unnamed protein product [Amoebophrya sp. A120]|nr:unnamed protein product [Amoebophrya sp. A120]|eukprot:GSA120T00013774001.1